MNELQIFSNPEFGQVRIVEIANEPYFVGRDIATILGYVRPNEAISAHCKGTAKHRIPTTSGAQEMLVIPESDVYRLVFRSKLPAAERFEDWVVKDVLPAIRKHGGYLTPESIEKAILNPDFILKLAGQLKTEQEARRAAEARIEADAPKVAYAEFSASSKDTVLIREFCHCLPKEGIKMGERQLYAWLVNNKILMKKYEGYDVYQRYANQGIFERAPRALPTEAGKTPRLRYTIKLTVKGQIWLLDKLKKWHSGQDIQTVLAL